MANAYLEGTYSEFYPSITRDEDGLRRLFRQFSFPGGIPSHVAPETPGSINEGGELGYSLAHAYGAAFDNPDLLVVCVIGDGEAETGPLAASWQSNKFLDPVRDGAVLPILHLNGYKIAQPDRAGAHPRGRAARVPAGRRSPSVLRLGRRSRPTCTARWRRRSTWSSRRSTASRSTRARTTTRRARAWPMIVLRTPKGWTGPKEVDGLPVEGTFRSHQVPVADVRGNPAHLKILEDWLRSYRPEELFDERGELVPELAALAAQGLPPHERQPARQRRRAAARPRRCPTSATTPSRCRRRAAPGPRRRACSAPTCAT